MSTPKRIQRKRTKGWRMPEGAVYVGRPGKWGNPIYVRVDIDDPNRWWIVQDDPEGGHTELDWHHGKTDALGAAADQFADDLTSGDPLGAAGAYPNAATIRAELAGHDLACWCPLDQPCHADVLLELANT